MKELLAVRRQECEALQQAAEEQLAREYKEACEDGTADNQILTNLEFELLHIQDQVPELSAASAAEAEEERQALAAGRVEDAEREVVDVDMLPPQPRDIVGYLNSLKPKAFISRGVLEKIFTLHGT